MEKIYSLSLAMGCDPEFFFVTKNGDVIGSEKIINQGTGILTERGKVIVDGVQAEINPYAATCRETLAYSIKHCLGSLREEMEAQKVGLSFAPAVKVTKKELDSLSEKSKVFGCAPSKNIAGENKITVNAAEYLFRGAGGHIHIGSNVLTPARRCMDEHAEEIITTLDILLGNTCVLLDRNAMNKERRKVYGRAGEYRTPSHGLEYRTLSNFWLRSYQTMSFVMGMARFAVSLVCFKYQGNGDYTKELFSKVDLDDIRKAINENDFKLAKKNWDSYKQFLIDYAGEGMPLWEGNIQDFEYFVKKGLDYWFGKDIFAHWLNLDDVYRKGWESFLQNMVHPRRIRHVGAKSALIAMRNFMVRDF